MNKMIKSCALFISISLQISLSAQTWESVGPHERPATAGGGSESVHKGLGRVNVIRFHPDYNGTSNEIIYAGSSRGGVWKTINGGDSWAVLNTDTLPVLAVSDIAIHPQKPDTIFLATGGQGKFKSPEMPAPVSWLSAEYCLYLSSFF